MVSWKAWNGCLVWHTMVWPSAVTSVIGVQNGGFWPVLGLRNRLKSSTTLAGDNGAPIWYLRPERRWKVQPVGPLEKESASIGTICPSGFRITRASNRALKSGSAQEFSTGLGGVKSRS